MICFSINFTYADSKCWIKDFQFNDIFEKNKDLDFIYLLNWVLEYLKIAPPFDIKNKTNFEKNNEIFINTYLYYLFNSYFYFLNCDYEKSINNYLSWINFPIFDKNNRASQDIQYIDSLIYWSFSYFLSGDFNKSLEILEKVLNRLNIILNYEKSNYFQQIYWYDKDKFNDYLIITESLVDYIIKIKLLQTSDEYSWEQYYLSKLNIIQAWKNQNFWCKEFLSNWECKTIFSWKENIIIAVIDDWINLNHLDITNKVWTNQKEIPWNGIDDDNNWYIDDFNGWNFYYNDNNTLPMGNHGTAVAWIIWAESNNWIWMAWIIPNAKIMSLWVFNETWETETENIIKAVNYAIDNNADIINLSLAGTQFIFTQEYNAVFKKAYEKNIPIIVSAWNGDVLSWWKIWVNTTVNKLSPVCNDYWNEKIIFWIWSLQENWEKSKWSNYWDCVDFWTFWENIFSLSLWDEDSEYGENYNKFYWTSFSTPILSWIIWLWINKVWNVKIDLIYEALEKSILPWLIWKDWKQITPDWMINTNFFIDNLIILSNEETKKQEEIRKQESMKKLLQDLAKKKNEERIQKIENDSKKVPEESEINQDFYVNSLLFVKNNYLVILLSFIIIILWFVSFKQREN